MTDAAMRIEVLADKGHINLRGDSRGLSFVEATESVLDQKLPLRANTVTEGEYTKLIVRGSSSAYFLKWLRHASAEYGVQRIDGWSAHAEESR